jgi:hypothetical protein
MKIKNWQIDFTPGEFVIYILVPGGLIDGDITCGRYAFGIGPPDPG